MLRRNALLLFVLLGLFVTFNKAAFQSYFSDDDFSNLLTARWIPWLGLPKAILSVGFHTNVRPLGLAYYKVLGLTGGFHFTPYVVVLQALHVATALMLWVFLRRLGIDPWAAGLGCFFFMLHMSALPAYWKPMYVFDVLCGFWVIMSLLFYQRDSFVLSFTCAWLGFRSKEMELMLPFFLLLYEWQLGKKRWKPLVPFFLMSLSFGIQALLQQKGPETVYSMRLTLPGLWSRISYYGTRLLYAPVSGLMISAGLLLLRIPMVWFGVLGFWVLLAPMLFFPGLGSGAYLYVPLLAFTVALAAAAQWKPWWAVVFLAIWIPASYQQLRVNRSPLLAYRYEHRPYVEQVLAYFAAHPAPKAVVYEGTPADFHVWGQEGLFRYTLENHDLPVHSILEPEALAVIRRPGTVLLTWDVLRHRLLTDHFRGAGYELSYVDFEETNPVWQLKEGWKPLIGGCRWVAPRSVITLRQPRGQLILSIRAGLAPGQAERLHELLQISSPVQMIGDYRFTKSGFQTMSWKVSSPVESIQDFEITVSPEFRASEHTDALGIRICAVGFVDQTASTAPPRSSDRAPQSSQR